MAVPTEIQIYGSGGRRRYPIGNRPGCAPLIREWAVLVVVCRAERAPVLAVIPSTARRATTNTAYSGGK